MFHGVKLVTRKHQWCLVIKWWFHLLCRVPTYVNWLVISCFASVSEEWELKSICSLTFTNLSCKWQNDEAYLFFSSAYCQVKMVLMLNLQCLSIKAINEDDTGISRLWEIFTRMFGFEKLNTNGRFAKIELPLTKHSFRKLFHLCYL